jgi:hypothetical protein
LTGDHRLNTDAVSTVFGSMIATCGDASDTVHLTDPDLEKGHPLQAVFELLAALDRDDFNAIAVVLRAHLSTSGLSSTIIALAKKYDIKSIIAAIKIFLYGLATRYPPEGGQYCIEAAHLGEWALCGHLIAALHEASISDVKDKTGVRRMLDWRGSSHVCMAVLARAGSRFSWAVLQSGMKNASIKNARIDYRGMGRDLAKLMSL